MSGQCGVWRSTARCCPPQLSPPGCVLEGVGEGARRCHAARLGATSAVDGAGGDPVARDTPGRGQRASVTLARAAGAEQCRSVPESRPGLPGVPCDHRAQIQSPPRNRITHVRCRDIQTVTKHEFPRCREVKTPLLWVLISPPCAFFFLLAGWFAPSFLTEGIYLAEQDCKKSVHVRGSKGFPPCCGWEMKADVRPVLSVPATHPARHAHLSVHAVSAPRAACCQGLLHRCSS